jgi:hypothetical protein
MARCEGTTKSGDRCKLDARPGSRFCHLHQPEEEGAEGARGEGAGKGADELGDLVPLLLAGAAALGVLLVLRGVGRLFPRL